MRARALRPPTIVLAKSQVRAVAGRDPTELTGETLLGRYRVGRLIGKGGMAVVYAGRHTAIDRAVAIKVLRRRYADEPDTVARFLREARASSLVRHEHIVEVTDFGTTEDGLVFMVMEHLEGETLAEVLQREGRMPWSRVHGIALQLCDALHAAHRAGVVHRDITLRNCVRIRRRANREYIKLVDFGIAKVLGPMMAGVAPSDPRRLTSDMDVFGTPEFMSPEQARRSMDADPRSDVYATGVLLYALLTGRLPFEAGSAAEVMARHIYDDVPPPSLHEPGLPAAVEAVVLRALEKRPDRRFQSMAEFAAAIQAIPREAIGDSAATAAAASWSAPAISGTTGLLLRRRAADRRRAWLGTIAVLAALGFGVSGWLGDHDAAPAAATSDAVVPAAMLPAAMLPAARTPTSTATTSDEHATPYLPSIAPRLHVTSPKPDASSMRSRSRSPRATTR
jgi:eukaryotic-like serine/threonine-protein kinase